MWRTSKVFGNPIRLITAYARQYTSTLARVKEVDIFKINGVDDDETLQTSQLHEIS